MCAVSPSLIRHGLVSVERVVSISWASCLFYVCLCRTFPYGRFVALWEQFVLIRHFESSTAKVSVWFGLRYVQNAMNMCIEELSPSWAVITCRFYTPTTLSLCASLYVSPSLWVVVTCAHPLIFLYIAVCRCLAACWLHVVLYRHRCLIIDVMSTAQQRDNRHLLPPRVTVYSSRSAVHQTSSDWASTTSKVV